jgi:hypothetical protein
MARHVLIRGFLLASLLVATAGAAWAHSPIVIDGGPTDATTAYEVADVSVSRVAYHHAKPGQPFLWLTFQGNAGQALDLQMGVPKIDRYAAIRPATAILGPGLPTPPQLPFTVPGGLGAVVLSTEGQTPTVFDEAFTGTTDWQFGDEAVTLPQDGKYYAVTYLPSGEEGKFFIALGKKEAFGLEDLLHIPMTVVKVRSFHEIFPWGGILGWAYLSVVLLFLAGFYSLVHR